MCRYKHPLIYSRSTHALSQTTPNLPLYSVYACQSRTLVVERHARHTNCSHCICQCKTVHVPHMSPVTLTAMYGIPTFSTWTYSPGHFSFRTVPFPFLHGVGHFPLPPPPPVNLQCDPPSTCTKLIAVDRLDSEYGLVPVFKCSL